MASYHGHPKLKKGDIKMRKDFDLEVVHEGFHKCLLEDGTVTLTEYLGSFGELCRFFKLSGRLFSFVAKDLDSKISAIQKRMSSQEYGTEYVTVQSMLDYEIRKNITHQKGRHSSGARNLLRLHRSLEFIIMFMTELSVSSDDTRVSRVAADVYGRTLGKHHPWMVRKMAGLAMFLLPNRKQLIDIMCKQDPDEVWVLNSRVVEAAQPVYDTVQELYGKHKLLNIP